jgi:hypothetical protein
VTRVVIDPGVLVSAFISPRKAAPALLVDAFLDGHFEMLVSPKLIAELTDVLGREKFAAHAADGRAAAWIVTGSALSGDSALTAASPPVHVRAHRRTHGSPAHLKAKAAAAKRGLPPGSVVTVGPILLIDERVGLDLRPDYTALVTNDLFSHCASRGITFVDTSEAFLKFAHAGARPLPGGPPRDAV